MDRATDEIRIDGTVNRGANALGADSERVAQWVAAFDAPMLALAERLTGDRHLALDVRQQAWVRVLRGRREFGGGSPPKSWFLRIVLNLCRDRAREHQRARTAWIDAAQVLDSASDPPSISVERDETRRRVCRALQELPHDQREVLVLAHYHGLGVSETARLLEKPRTTVQSTLARGLERLRWLLRDLVDASSDGCRRNAAGAETEDRHAL